MTARKAGEKFKAKVLATLKSELINNSKAKKPQKEQQVVQTYAKKLEKAAHAFKSTDKYEDLKKEIEIVQGLLPKMMAPELVLKEVESYFSTNPEANQGQAIKALKDQLGSQNGRYIVQYVQSKLE